MTNSCTAEQSSGIFADSKLFSKYHTDPELKIAVILPVRNEEDNIIKALDALRNQVNDLGKPLSPNCYEVLMLANNCTDQSVKLAKAYKKKFPHFALHIEDIKLDREVAHIGTVRRLLMDAAYERFVKLNTKKGIIASTDSDSEVDNLWIYQTLLEINLGNDVVGGRIFTRPDKSTSRLYYLRDITYRHLVSQVEDLLDPLENDRWPRHFQCFGASFAVTCSIYDISGRLPAVPFLEDMAFHKSLIRVDAKIRLSPHVRVFTSARIEGKVDFGLSIQLKQWGEMNQCSHPMMVEPAGSVIAKFRARNLLRRFWQTRHTPVSINDSKLVMEAADILKISDEWIFSQAESTRYFGKLWEDIQDKIVEEGWADLWPAMDVVDVIPDLKTAVAGMLRKN